MSSVFIRLILLCPPSLIKQNLLICSKKRCLLRSFDDFERRRATADGQLSSGGMWGGENPLKSPSSLFNSHAPPHRKKQNGVKDAKIATKMSIFFLNSTQLKDSCITWVFPTWGSVECAKEGGNCTCDGVVLYGRPSLGGFVDQKSKKQLIDLKFENVGNKVALLTSYNK